MGLGERLTGSQEVSGSIPLISTKKTHFLLEMGLLLSSRFLFEGCDYSARSQKFHERFAILFDIQRPPMLPHLLDTFRRRLKLPGIRVGKQIGNG